WGTCRGPWGICYTLHGIDLLWRDPRQKRNLGRDGFSRWPRWMKGRESRSLLPALAGELALFFSFAIPDESLPVHPSTGLASLTRVSASTMLELFACASSLDSYFPLLLLHSSG